MDTIEIPSIPIPRSTAPPTVKCETRNPGYSHSVGKRVLSKPMDSPEIILFTAQVLDKATILSTGMCL